MDPAGLIPELSELTARVVAQSRGAVVIFAAIALGIGAVLALTLAWLWRVVAGYVRTRGRLASTSYLGRLEAAELDDNPPASGDGDGDGDGDELASIRDGLRRGDAACSAAAMDAAADDAPEAAFDARRDEY